MIENFEKQLKKSEQPQNQNEGVTNKQSNGEKGEEYQARKQRSIETANENIKTFMECAEEQGYDWNDKNFIYSLGKRFLGDMNELFGKEYGLSVAAEDLPEIFVYEKTNACYAPWYKTKDSDEKKPLNAIFVGRINDILNGNTMGEELAHFYRLHFEPNSGEELITSEFFGFLGKRLWEKAAEKELDSLNILKNDAEHVIESKKMFNIAGRVIKQATKSIVAEAKRHSEEADDEETKKFLQELAEEIEEVAQKTRKDSVAHQRGYEMALKLDIDRITDYKKLFSMPNAEVRKRFFTDKPDYSGL